MLTKDDVRQFHETGWLHRQALFTAAEITRMRECFDALERIAESADATGMHEGAHFVLGRLNGSKVIKRVVWAGGAAPYLLEIGADQRLLRPAAGLLGSNTVLQLLNQAHFKRPRDGVIFGWHQDIQHRDKGNGTWTDVNGQGSFVQTLIVIDEMTAESGALQFIPGSSTWGAVDFGEHDYDDPASVSQYPPGFDESTAVTVHAMPGDTLFFGPYTAHASFENRSDGYRRVLINGYASPGANGRVYPGSGLGRTLHVR